MDTWFCSRCELQCLTIQSPTCPFCDRLSPLGKTCSRCQKKYKLNGSRSFWYYRGPALSFIKKLKYQHQFAAIEHILPELVKLYSQLPISPVTTVIITSIPSHNARISQYGFNQSEMLAQALARAINKPYQSLLTRKYLQSSQTTLNRSDRFKAAARQFTAKKIDLNRPTFVIIDDVLTTGATLATCAEKLKENGAKAAWAITLAKD